MVRVVPSLSPSPTPRVRNESGFALLRSGWESLWTAITSTPWTAGLFVLALLGASVWIMHLRLIAWWRATFAVSLTPAIGLRARRRLLARR